MFNKKQNKEHRKINNNNIHNDIIIENLFKVYNEFNNKDVDLIDIIKVNDVIQSFLIVVVLRVMGDL
jgi:hypothetical protein